MPVIFVSGTAATIIEILFFAIKAAIPILAIVLLIKAIRYFKRQEDRNRRQDYRNAQDTLDEIERELNNRKD